MANNKVKVRIYGQDYTLTGEREETEIIEIAEYVDKMMKDTAQLFTQGSAPGSIAVLTCVNIADEYFQHKHDIDSLRDKNRQLEKEADNYMKMWEDAKKNYSQYKEGASKASIDIQALNDKIKELEAKCSEFESSYFEAQMENIQLKDQLEKMNR